MRAPAPPPPEPAAAGAAPGRRAGMSARDVLDVLDRLAAAHLPAWVDGGWGVDALLGEQSRPHADLDLVVRLDDTDRVLEQLAALEVQLHLDLRPTRLVAAAADGRSVDLHPVTFAADGTGWQAGAAAGGGDCPYPPGGFGTGRIGGRTVPCLTAQLQVAHHSGYPPADRDRADMQLLAARCGVPLPPELAGGPAHSGAGRPGTAGQGAGSSRITPYA